jgi:hypothetical protein
MLIFGSSRTVTHRAGDRSRDANPMPLVMSAGTYQSEQGYNRVARVEA